MGERESQIFGCFSGILGAVIISQIISVLMTLPLWLEYVVIGISAVVISVLVINITRKSQPIGQIPPSPPTPPPSQGSPPSSSPSQQQP